MNLIQERVEEISKIHLKSGKHKSFGEGACVMEVVGYVAGESWSDFPKCACPVLTRFAQRVNDRVDDETRQKLKPFIIRLAGSKSDRKTSVARARFLAHQAVSVFLPLLTEALGLDEITATLRGFSSDELGKASSYCREKRQEIRTAAAYAYAAADASAAAYAAAYADADASAAAYAYADAKKWRKVRQAIWEAQIAALDKAIDIK